ncbi:hypothetical protein [Intestinimonas sp. HCP28S3_D6]|uniref:hypothetical protein n=1 Tax=Intestinimonas sp. HCP28S3_D6 TaxID=3438942 RepID=UPI003F898808
MKKVKYAFFTFPPSDCEAAQLWLTRLYDQGWELAHLPHFILPAKFIPRTRDDIKYCVDLSHGVRDPNFAPDGFDQLVKESGWALVGTSRSGLDVYKSLPDRDPIPIQTDPALFKKAFFRRELLPTLLVFLIVVLFLILLGSTLGLRTTLPTELLTSNLGLLNVVIVLYMIVFAFVTVGWELRFWLRSSPPTPNLRLARLKSFCGTLFYLCWLFCLILIPLTRVITAEQPTPAQDPQAVATLPLLRLEDLDLPDNPLPWFRRQSSILASALELEETTDGISLTQNRWDCRFGWVADQIVADTLASYERSMPYTPAALGFDQVWTYTDDSGFHSLLLRQGNTVVQLYGNLDLTTPDRLERLRDALELAS